MFIKRIDCRTHSNELNIASRLGSPNSRKDERNHCVHILAIFSDDRDPWYQYIVMPVLRPFNQPNFSSFGETVDFVNQTLEASFFTPPSVFVLMHLLQGLFYIHEQNVAHRWVDFAFPAGTLIVSV